MKKFLIVTGIIIGLLFLATTLIPIIFRDDIKSAVDKALAESIDAQVVYEADNFGISIFSHFPNPAARIEFFGIINNAPFEGEYLFAVEEMEVVIDLGSVLFGDQIKIKGIDLYHPLINLKVLEDGRANWDIAKETEQQGATAEANEPVTYNIGIEEWNITNGEVFYEDATIPFELVLKGLNHRGSGDFTQDVIDMSTFSEADSLSVKFDGVEYIGNRMAEVVMDLRISEDYSKYEFRENQVRINDFVFSFDGGFSMLEDGYGMDLTFQSRDNSFKSVLSILPGMYTSNFDDLQASGELNFEGMVKGNYDSLQFPTYDITLNVSDGGFKYPELQKSFSDIQLNLNILNETPDINNTRIALKNFHMVAGEKSFDGKLIIENLINYPVDAELRGSIDFAEWSQLIPMKELTLKGLLAVDLKASGIYDSVRQLMPSLNSSLSYSDGFIKSSEFPSAIENFNVQASIQNPTGKFSDFEMDMSRFSFQLDGEAFEGNLKIRDLNNLAWNLVAQGSIDLKKMANVMDFQEMSLEGKIDANITTSGNMAALEAERYDQLPTSGAMSLVNFSYSDNELPDNITISEAKTSFDPSRMAISNMDGTIGESDFSVDGYITNYLGYALSDDEKLYGSFNLRSKYLNLNEVMSEEAEESEALEDTTAMAVIVIPKNIDLTLTSNIEKVRIMDMEMSNVKGSIIARDGIARMENVNFNLLEGQFSVNGSYNTVDVTQPKYDFGLNIEDVSIPKAFSTFDIVKKYIPIAEKMTGKFSTDFKINGLLNDEMSPILSSVDGEGLVKILQASLTDSKIVQGITSVTKLNDTDEVDFNDLRFSASIEDGSLKVKPFVVSLLGYKAVVSGASTLDGNLGFNVNLDVPAAKANELMSALKGSAPAGETITLPIRIGGSYNDPKIGLETSGMKNEIKETLTSKAKDEAKEGIKDVVDKALEDGKLKDAVGDLLGGNKQKDTSAADTLRQPTIKDKVEEEATQQIKNLFKKKKNNN